MATDDLTPRRDETRTRAAGVVMLALIAGIVLGVVADRGYLLYKHRIVPSHVPGHVPRMFVDHLSRRLDLTPQQRTQLEQILERRRARVGAIWSNVRPQIRKEIDETNAEIEKILTPDQREKFARIKNRLGPGRAHDFPRGSGD